MNLKRFFGAFLIAAGVGGILYAAIRFVDTSFWQHLEYKNAYSLLFTWSRILIFRYKPASYSKRLIAFLKLQQSKFNSIFSDLTGWRNGIKNIEVFQPSVYDQRNGTRA